MFHGSYCRGYSGQLYCGLFREIYCSYIYRMKREVSTAGKALQRLVMWISRRNPFWQQEGAVRFPAPPAHLCLERQRCLKPAVVSVSEKTADSGTFPLAEETHEPASISLPMQWFRLTDRSFLAGEEASASAVNGRGESGEQPDRRYFAISRTI